ncbi:ankyrin repeat-containing domain protein [Nemania sp. NC0429]|nr:ankyrin repeat-containing domain protein [Nemania sp. NC0429]
MCEGNELCWRCPGSPWDLAAQSGLEAAVKCLHKSGVPQDPIRESDSTPLHCLGEFASKNCAEFLMQLFPTSKNVKFNELTPLESFIRRCVRAGKIPQPGVIDVLAYDSTSADLTESNSTLWENFCSFCGKDLSLEYPRLSEAQISCLQFVFSALTEKKITEAYEDFKQRVAAIPLLSTLECLGLFNPRLLEIINELVSRTKLQESACVAEGTIEYVKLLLRNLKYWNSPVKQDLEEQISTLLASGIDVHRRNGQSSILEQACQSFDCGESNEMGSDMILSVLHASERRIFSQIVNRASPVQLNENCVEYRLEYLISLAKKGYHSGASWMVEKLITKGLDPNKCRIGPHDRPILSFFLQTSATPAAISLLRLGADPSLRSAACISAFLSAAQMGNLEFLRSLFPRFADHSTLWEEKADLNFRFGTQNRTFYGLYALHIASANGHIDCIRFLIDNGLFPNVESTTEFGYNCLHFAALNNCVEIIKYLSSVGLDVNQFAEDGSLPLHFAVRNGHVEAVDVLLTLGSDYSPDCFGMTPQMYAESLKDPSIRQLLESRRNNYSNNVTKGTHQILRQKSKLIRQTLESAIYGNDLRICQELNNQGLSMDVAMPSCGACSPLILAVRYRRERIISWLLEERISVLLVACRQHGGLSVPELALQYGISEILVRRILDIHVDTAENLEMIVSATFQAVLSRNHAVLRLIIEHIKENLESDVSGDSPEVILANIINRTSDDDSTSLHYASSIGDLGTVEILLKAGAGVDALNKYERTPLQLSSNPLCVDRLIAAGSKVGWLDPASPRMALNRIYPMLPMEVQGSLGEQVLRHWGAKSRNFPVPVTWTFLADSPRLAGMLFILQQNNVDLNALGYSQTTILHSILRDCEASSFVLSLPQIVDSKPFPWHTIGVQFRKIPWINEHWRLFKKRIPFDKFQHMMNLHPEQGISPLCRAAALDALEVIDHCLEMGADIDFDGSSYGSALMAACANSRLEAVKHLVRRGASIVYHGEFGITSAIEAADGHKKIITWLLVGQFTEQAKLEYTSLQDSNTAESIRAWSGVQQKPMRLTGSHERKRLESLRDYIFRLAQIRGDMRGRRLPLRKEKPTTGFLVYQI